MRILILSMLLTVLFCGCDSDSEQAPSKTSKAIDPMEQYIGNSGWKVAKAEREVGPALLRFRTPVHEPGIDNTHPILLKILWAYADENTGALPTEAQSDEMRRFEDLLVEAVEENGLAVLAAVITFDGARQWVFYTRNLEDFARHLSAIPDFNGNAYPIELTTDEDPEWSYLRDEILGPVPKDQWGI